MSTVQIDTSGNPFVASQACRSLLSAYRRELHARRLYQQCARRMEEASLGVIAYAFRFTAAQEKEHADIFRGLLVAHGVIKPPAAEDVPILLPCDPLEMLQTVIDSEQEEACERYPLDAGAAAEEGYTRIATVFRRIAETEQMHVRRFRQYMQALQEGTLFQAEEKTAWFCLTCGQIHTGQAAPDHCSGCGGVQGQFIRSCYYPFAIFD